MPLVDEPAAEIQAAMRSREQITFDALRMLKTALTMKSVEKGRDLDDAESVQVVGALVKQRRDSVEQFTKAGRQELADKEAAEILGAPAVPSGSRDTRRRLLPQWTRPSRRPARRR